MLHVHSQHLASLANLRNPMTKVIYGLFFLLLAGGTTHAGPITSVTGKLADPDSFFLYELSI